jgi:hypothetical protein
MRLHDRLGRARDNPDSNLRADKCQDSCLIGNSRAARVAISGNLSSAGVTERHQRPKL